jgi:hypothetical protein
MHAADNICFISSPKKPKKKEREENGKKKFLFQAVHEPGFRRAGEGPKNTKGKKRLLCSTCVISKKLWWKLT